MSEQYWGKQGRAQEYGDRSPSPFVTDFFRSIPSHKLTPEVVGADIGCGGGRHIEFLASLGILAIGIDKYVKMLDFTRQRLLGAGLCARLMQAEMDSLPFRGEAVDYVISNGVLHNAISVEQITLAMSEISRVLKPGGVLLLNLFTKGIISPELVLTDQKNTWLTADNIPMVLLEPKKVEEALSDFGLRTLSAPSEKIVDVETGKRNVYKSIFKKLE